MSSVTWPFWMILGLVWLALLVLDARPWSLNPRSMRAAFIWSVLWLAAGLGATAGVYHLYGDGGLYDLPQGTAAGQVAATQYVAVFVVQKALTLGNLLLAALIFASAKLSLDQQQRLLPLSAGVLVATRLAAIALGVALVQWWEPGLVLLGLVLFVVAARLLVARHDNQLPDYNLGVWLLRQRYGYEPAPEARQFIVRSDGHVALTPLAVALICLLTANLWFAVASAPGTLAITSDNAILWPATLAALLGLRSLYELVAGIMERLNFLKSSLAFLLAFAGVNALLVRDAPIPPAVTLAVLAGMLAVGLMATLLGGSLDTAPLQPPVGSRLQPQWPVTYRHAKRVVIAVVGGTVVLMGLVMLLLPGPGVLTVAAGLAILATEFLWAKRWLARVRQRIDPLAHKAATWLHWPTRRKSS
jgi:tellurite resistance protein TerC